MLEYFEGTVFNLDVDAIVNTINCVGVMSAGIALEFGLRYPDLLFDYKEKCRNKEINIGQMYYFKTKDKVIVNFPTKWHFKYPSNLKWIEDGLKHFVATYKLYNIKSIAFPKLGVLNGHLSWTDVKSLMEKYLANLDIIVYICLDTKTEAEGLEKKMLDVFNNIVFNDIKNDIRLSVKQVEVLQKSIPLSRFWKIRDLDGIGASTYKNLFLYCLEKSKKQTYYEQLKIF